MSTEGEILAIEVKPHTASDKDIAWSVLQAGMYADLFQRWADYAGGKAHEVLHGMAAQRKRRQRTAGTGRLRTWLQAAVFALLCVAAQGAGLPRWSWTMAIASRWVSSEPAENA